MVVVYLSYSFVMACYSLSIVVYSVSVVDLELSIDLYRLLIVCCSCFIVSV